MTARTALFVLGSVLAPFVIGFLGLWLLAALARRFATDPYAVSSGYVYRFRGQNDRLRVQALERRQTADAIRKSARAVETRDDRRELLERQPSSGIRMVS